MTRRHWAGRKTWLVREGTPLSSVVEFMFSSSWSKTPTGDGLADFQASDRLVTATDDRLSQLDSLSAFSWRAAHSGVSGILERKIIKVAGCFYF